MAELTATDELLHAARFVNTALDSVQDARGLLAIKKIDEAREYLAIADRYLQEGLAQLVVAGVELPPGTPRPLDVPLELLSTPASRQLLTTLRTAAEDAAQMDIERGWVLDDGTPCGWSELLRGLVLRLALEVEGPKGRE